MAATRCRLLPFAIADGPTNMATDEVMLRWAIAGVASLRFYCWSPATLSLGYFQREAIRHGDPLVANLPFVRRPTGGETLVHHLEVTYALALPAGPLQQRQGWTRRMHLMIGATLHVLGIETSLWDQPAARLSEGPLCFQHITAGDLTIAGHKVAGSAQRKSRGALLQHGALLLARSTHTPGLPGIRELAGQEITVPRFLGAMGEVFAAGTATDLEEYSLTIGDQQAIDDLKACKYATRAWNDRR